MKPPQRVLTPDEVRQRYNRQAEQYQTRYVGVKGDYYRRFEDQLFLEFLEAHGKRVLDLGTGRGRLALMLASVAKEVIGIDISEEMIRHARDAGRGIDNVRFELGDALKLHYPSKYFDVASSMGMFPYVKDVYPFLCEINRVLVPGGLLAFSVCNAGEWQHTTKLYASAYRTVQRLRGRGVAAPAEEDSPLIPHDIQQLHHELHRAGFDPAGHRSTFFFLPSRVFYWAGRRSLTPLQDLAARANALLGKLPITRDHGKVLVMFARKREDVL